MSLIKSNLAHGVSAHKWKGISNKEENARKTLDPLG
jgi:hypothetical protein